MLCRKIRCNSFFSPTFLDGSSIWRSGACFCFSWILNSIVLNCFFLELSRQDRRAGEEWGGMWGDRGEEWGGHNSGGACDPRAELIPLLPLVLSSPQIRQNARSKNHHQVDVFSVLLSGRVDIIFWPTLPLSSLQPGSKPDPRHPWIESQRAQKGNSAKLGSGLKTQCKIICCEREGALMKGPWITKWWYKSCTRWSIHSPHSGLFPGDTIWIRWHLITKSLECLADIFPDCSDLTLRRPKPDRRARSFRATSRSLWGSAWICLSAVLIGPGVAHQVGSPRHNPQHNPS